MNKGLQNYLNDHLSGSRAAMKLVDHLIKATRGEPGNGFFKGLKRSLKGDQQRLIELMDAVGVKKRRFLKLADTVTGRTSRFKLIWEGEPLGMFEALELLALSLQAKRLLWRILDEVSPHFPEWMDFNFIQLEKEALVQRDAIEDLRRNAGKVALTT